MQPTEEAIPLMAYLNRHRCGVFWTLRDDMGGVMGNHWLFRLLLGWAMPPVVWLLKLFASRALQEEVALKRVYRDDIFHHLDQNGMILLRRNYHQFLLPTQTRHKSLVSVTKTRIIVIIIITSGLIA